MGHAVINKYLKKNGAYTVRAQLRNATSTSAALSEQCTEWLHKTRKVSQDSWPTQSVHSGTFRLPSTNAEHLKGALLMWAFQRTLTQDVLTSSVPWNQPTNMVLNAQGHTGGPIMARLVNRRPVCHCRGPVSAPGYWMWDLQRTKSGTATGSSPTGTSDISCM